MGLSASKTANFTIFCKFCEVGPSSKDFLDLNGTTSKDFWRKSNPFGRHTPPPYALTCEYPQGKIGRFSGKNILGHAWVAISDVGSHTSSKKKKKKKKSKSKNKKQNKNKTKHNKTKQNKNKNKTTKEKKTTARLTDK